MTKKVTKSNSILIFKVRNSMSKARTRFWERKKMRKRVVSLPRLNQFPLVKRFSHWKALAIEKHAKKHAKKGWSPYAQGVARRLSGLKLSQLALEWIAQLDLTSCAARSPGSHPVEPLVTKSYDASRLHSCLMHCAGAVKRRSADTLPPSYGPPE